MTQEIRLLCYITLEVSTELNKEELIERLNSTDITIWANLTNSTNLLVGWEEFNSILDIIDIEEESELYGTE